MGRVLRSSAQHNRNKILNTLYTIYHIPCESQVGCKGEQERVGVELQLKIGSVRSSVCCGSAQVAVAQINFKSKYNLAYTLILIHTHVRTGCVCMCSSGFWLKAGNFCVVYLWELRKLPEQPQTNWSAHKFYSRRRPTSTSTLALTHTRTHTHISSLTYSHTYAHTGRMRNVVDLRADSLNVCVC